MKNSIFTGQREIFKGDYSDPHDEFPQLLSNAKPLQILILRPHLKLKGSNSLGEGLDLVSSLGGFNSDHVSALGSLGGNRLGPSLRLGNDLGEIGGAGGQLGRELGSLFGQLL